MTYKQIEASREIRLWIGQVIVPAMVLAVSIPEVREKAKAKAIEIRSNIQTRFHKG